MRKILFLSIVLALAASLVGLGVQAQLVDTELAVNKIQAGALDLTVNGQNGQPAVIEFTCVAPMKPCDPGLQKCYTLKNIGCLDGYLNVKSIKVENEECKLIEPESEAGDTTEDVGELGDRLIITMWFDGDPWMWGDEYLGPKPANWFDGKSLKWNQSLLKAGTDADFVVEIVRWPNDGDQADSQCMTDRVTITITLELSQFPK